MEVENPPEECQGIKSLPIEFFSELVPEGTFEAQFDADKNKIVFPDIRAAKCLEGGSAPITLGLQQNPLSGHYIITAKISDTAKIDDQEGQVIDTYDKFFRAFRTCVKDHYGDPPQGTTSAISISTEGHIDITRPLVWGVTENTFGHPASTRTPFGDNFLKKENGDAGCFKAQRIASSPVIVYNERDKNLAHYIGRCEDCQETLAQLIEQDPGFAGTVKALWQLSMNLFRNDFNEHFKEIPDEDEEDDDGEGSLATQMAFIEEMKEFLLGEGDDGAGGLVQHYLQLLDEIKGIPRADRNSANANYRGDGGRKEEY